MILEYLLFRPNIRHRAAACGGTGGVSLGLVRSAGLLVCRPLREPQGHSPSDPRLPFFMFFWGSFFNPPKSTFGPPWCQLGAQMTSKSEPKEGPGSHQKSISSKNLPNSILTTIYYTLAMSATPKRHQFRSLKSPKIVEKSKLEKYLQKNDKKCLQITFLSNFGSPLVPRGVGSDSPFFVFF